MKYLVLTMMMLLSIDVYATGRDDDVQASNTNTNQQVQGQLQGQAQGQAQNAESTSISGAAAGAISGSSSNASGGTASASGGNAISSSKATGGLGIGVGKGGEGGSSQSDSSNSSAIVLDASNDYDKPAASSAPSLFIGTCQEGASGQSYSGGASSAFDSAQCTMLRQAAENQKLAMFFEEKGDKAQAKMYFDRMAKNMADAEQAADNMYYPKQFGGFFLTILPVGLLFLI